MDDSPAFLDSAEALLRGDARVEVVGRAQSGTAGIALARRAAPDLVLLDVSMPGMSGFAAARLLKAQPKPPHIVLMSLNDEPEYQRASLAAGADDFIAKADLTERVQRMIGSFIPRLT